MLRIPEYIKRQTSLLIIGTGLLAWMASNTPAKAAEQGGISLNQTRVIISAMEMEKAQPLTVTNSASQSYLIQTRIVRSIDGASAAPFFVTPPLFVLKPNSRQLLRIVPQGLESLPTDRESVFYLSVLAIPARQNKDAAPSQVSLGLRFTLKLFYRPAGLITSPDSVNCNLRFHTGTQGIDVYNPTPYHQTFGRLMFDHKPVDLDTQPSMIAPLSSQHYLIPHRATHAEWQLITDFGGLSSPVCNADVSAQGAP